MAIGKFLAPLNGRVSQTTNKPYVDDIFDPLFNAEVTNYYRNLYGPVGGIGAGYAAMLENALTGKKGILGPGMGILSTFGRSMDKADDFILGSLTEGVNILGRGLGGTNEAPQNPFRRIFVDDYNYEGTKLMAAAGNAMARLAGTQTPLTEQDFQSFGDKAAGTILDLATDPGIMGSQLARLNPNTPVGQAGQILNSYDDAIANVAGNMAFPGAKAIVGKGLTRIRDFLGGASSTSPIDTVTKTSLFDPNTGATSFTSLDSDTLSNLQNMAEDYKYAYNLNPMDTPDEYAMYEDIISKHPILDDKAYSTALDAYTKQQEAIKTYTEKTSKALEKKTQDYYSKITNEAFEGINKHPDWFRLKETGSIDADLEKLTGYTPEEFENLSRNEFLDLAQNTLYDPKLATDKEPFGKQYSYIEHLVDDELDLDQAKEIYKNYLSEKSKKYSSPFSFSQSDAGLNSVVGKEKLDLINVYTAEFLAKHPEGLTNSYLRKVIDKDTFIPKDIFEQLRQFTRGYASKGSKTKLTKDNFTAGKLSEILNLFKNQEIDVRPGDVEGLVSSKGLIPWVQENQAVLEKTQYGKDLIELANNLENTVFKTSNINYLDYATSNIGTTESIARVVNPIFDSQYLNKPEAMEEFAKSFPNFELTLNPNYRGTEYEKLYEHYRKFRADNKLYGTEFKTFTPVNIVEKSTKVLKESTKKEFATLVTTLKDFTPEDFTKVITSNNSLQDDTALDVFQSTFKEFATGYGLSDMGPEQIESYVKTFGTRQEKTLFQQWIAAAQSKVKNKLKTAHGALNVDIVKQSKKHVDDIVSSKKYTSEQIAEYISRKDISEGVKLSGDTFLEDLWASEGFKEFPIPKNYTKQQADIIARQIKDNVDKVNKYGNILKFADVVEDDKTRRLAIYFDVDNLNIKKDLNKIYSLFGKKDLDLQDVVLRTPTLSETKFDSSELDSVFDEIRQGSEQLATKLGYTKFSSNYISHVMDDSEDATKLFNGIFKSTGINKDKLDKLVQALKDQDIASGKLQFGARPMERSHLGYFNQYSKGFSTDLSKIHSNTFTKGMFDDSNAQTFFDLFVSDNFKIKQNFDNVETLKEALNASEGNLNNLSLVKPRYNDAGKLIGFTRYDKFTDASLQKAFEDDSAILVPDAVIGSLDRMCKKDARMSNKVYRFINKYLTVPFKFGTLANPGFLAGNIQDAYFKQAVELSKKYGTTLEDELTNVAMSMRQVTVLNNNFSNVFDDYKNWLNNTDFRLLTRSDKPDNWYFDTFKKSKNTVSTLSIDQVVNTPDLYSAFKEYLKYHAPIEKRKMANVYLFLNNNQTTTMFKNNNRDIEDLVDLVTDNPYAVPNNIVERIMYGDPSTKFAKDTSGKLVEVRRSGINSYGLFLNNPISNKILKSSNTIENWMRSSTIINDLQHKGYTLDDISDLLELDKVKEKAIRDKFKMSMNEAISTMHAANFDYDNVSEFMNKASYILPFPTFYLKNLAFWADIFTNKPQLIDNVISTHEGLWSGKDTNDEFVAEAKGRGAVPIGQQGLKHLTGIVKQTPYNSMFGAFNAINDPKEDFAFRTNPILRPVARHLQDKEDIKYRPYNTQQFQKNIVKGDKEFSELAYMFHQLNPYERVINTGLRTPGKVSNNTYQVSDFLPSIFQPDFSKKSKK